MRDDRQSTRARDALLLAAVLAITTAPPAIAAGAGPAVLDLSGFEGEVQLVRSETTQLRQPARGWKLDDRRGTHTLVKVEERRGVEPFGPVCGVPVASTLTRLSADRDSRGARVEIGVAPSTSVRAQRFSGTLRSSAPLREPKIDVDTGKVELAQVSGGELAVRGPGSLTIEEAGDKVDLAVDGTGAVQVGGGTTDELIATLQGSGSIRHDGIVKRAVLSASGDGTIRIRRVDDPVRVDQAGFASISTDCAEASCVR